jgi:hypothetical protein
MCGLAFAESVIVSVALLLKEDEYVVAFVEFDETLTTLPAEVAVTPRLDKFAFALTADLRPVAMDVRLSVDKTVYVTLCDPPVSAASLTFKVNTSPVVLVPAINAFSKLFLKIPAVSVSVAPTEVDKA